MIAAAWQFYGTFIYFTVPYLAGTWATDFPCSPFEFYTFVVGLNGYALYPNALDTTAYLLLHS